MKKFLLMAVLIAPLTAFAQKFGHFNSGDIVQAMPEYAAAQTELKNTQAQFEQELQRMQDEFQKKLADYEKEFENLLPNVKQRREAELEELQKRIQQNFQDNQQALQKLSQEKMEAITKKVTDALKLVGDAGGYVYIMDISNGTVPYINITLSTDITAELKAKLGLK